MTQKEYETFGKYQILERIASGGMAEIFKARIEGISGFHRYFAIKRILPHLSTQPEFIDLLIDEAKIAGLLSHANIVQILDLGRIDDHYYIAMEYVHGPDLGKILARCREKGITLPVPHAIFITIEILKGLEYAHNRQVMRGGRPVPLNIIHRDISPPNILISFQGEVKLTDFGIAKASIKVLETQAGVVRGRYDYLSPEQSEGKTLDQRSDLFSVGVVLYEMLVGRHPFRADNDLKMLEAIRSGRYTPASEVNFDIPSSLDIVLEQALAVRPEDRFQTATAFKEALDSFFHESGFIFSQSTLAAFLKGLFPELRTGPGGRRMDDPTRPFPRTAPLISEEPEPDEEEYRPTVVQDSPRAGRVSPFEPSPPLEDRPTLQTTSIADAATQLRGFRPPTGLGKVQPTVGITENRTFLRGNPLLGVPIGDQETQIKRKPVVEPTLERGTTPMATAKPTATLLEVQPALPSTGPRITTNAAALPSKDSRVSSPPVSESQPRAAEKTVPTTSVRKKSLTWSQAVYLAGSILTLSLGLVAGFLMGHRAASNRASSIPSSMETKKIDPILHLQYPSGATVSVDNRPISGTSPLTITLSPGTSHRIRVEMEGEKPIEFPILLDSNQAISMSVDWKSVEKTEKKSKKAVRH